jgi:NAD(P)-dependent dehydrogenase (short-subunit alcohol dehydrogenase family)
MKPLDGKIAIVTGASRGIGAEVARRFAAEGAKVAIAARTVDAGQSRLAGTINETAAQIEAAGGTVSTHRTDMSQAVEREALVAAVTEQLGPVDILVNNAAVTYFSPVADFSPRRYALMFEVQVCAPFHLAQLVLPVMRAKGQGWILNISSVAARHPRQPYGERSARGSTVYGMCKAALERLSTGLAAEVHSAGIAVNSLAPNNVVPTPGTLFHNLTTEDDPEAEPPEVMAEAALAMCTRPASELTGRIAYSQDLLVELGLSLPTR